MLCQPLAPKRPRTLWTSPGEPKSLATVLRYVMAGRVDWQALRRSARQTQIKVVDVRSIVTDLDLSQTAAGVGAVGGVATGGGGVGSAIQPISEQIELGPVLDVLPYVSADGYTIQMTIIPTIKEFLGYDLDTAKIFTAQAQSVGSGTAATAPLTQPTRTWPTG